MIESFKDHVDSQPIPKTRVLEQLAAKAGRARQAVSNQYYLKDRSDVLIVEFEGRRKLVTVLYDLGEV